MSLLKTLVLFTALAQTAFAHFTLDYPSTRGFNEDTEATAPCGSFDTVGNRTEFPLSNGFLEIYSGHTSWSYTVNVILGDNPSTADFSNTTAVGSGTRSYPENACLSVDLGSNSAIKDGVNGTLQIVYNGGDGLLYQCTDVTFTSKPSAWNNSVCVNADGSSTSATASSSGAAATSTSTSSAASLTITGSVVLMAAMFVSAIII